MLVFDLLPPAFLHASFSLLAQNLQVDSWAASATYIAVAAAVVAACFLLCFVLLVRCVFTVSSIVDSSVGGVCSVRSLLLPLRSPRSLRIWMAERINSPVMWFISSVQGTEAYNIFLRLLGAKIGRNCIILCSIDLPSLISVGDNCFIDNGARLRCSQVVVSSSNGVSKTAVRVGRIHIGAGSYVACQATITQSVTLPANSQVECDAYITEHNAGSVRVASTGANQSDSGYQRVCQSTALILLWLTLLALSLALIQPWVSSAIVIESSSASAMQDTSAESPFPLNGQPAGVTVWYYVILFELLIHPIAIVALVVFHRCIGRPPYAALAPTISSAISPPPPPATSSPPPPAAVHIPLPCGIPVGSWQFFIHVTLRRWFIRTFGFPLYTLQSSFIPAAVLRACGASVGRGTIVFNYDYGVELQVPLQQLTLGDDCIVTTFVQLGCPSVRDAFWSSHDVVVGSGCLLGNNSIIDTAGLPLPPKTWVSAMSHVTASSIATAAARPPHAQGCIICGNPTAAPLPVAPSTLLSLSSPTLMHPLLAAALSCIWAMLLAPALCPSSIEVLIVFFLVINSQWSFASMLLLIVCCEAAAFLWSSAWLFVFERASDRIVVQGAHHTMFTAKWWVFHWCDMFRARYISLWPQFFSDSPVFTWFMRAALGAHCAHDVTISEPHISEPALQTIGEGSVVSWNSWLQPHTYNAHTLILGAVAVGSGCFIDSHAALLPDSSMGPGSRLDPVTLLMKGDHVTAGACYAGVPARAFDAQDAAAGDSAALTAM